MDNKNVEEEVVFLANKAKKASERLALMSESALDSALLAMAEAILDSKQEILDANADDMSAAREMGTEDSILDRLYLDSSRIEDMARSLKDLERLPSPLHVVQYEDDMYNGIRIERISVPLGVVAIVYEARPNVTVDAAGICLKAGNACILRGGSLAKESNSIIAKILSDAAYESGLPEDCITYIGTTDRSATDHLMKLHGTIDLLIPRGGAGLIDHCVENSKVPVIETGTGNCHVYIHKDADPEMAENILINSKCRRYGVCNACESLLLDSALTDQESLRYIKALADKGVILHVDDRAFKIAGSSDIADDVYKLATEDDWGTEYLGPEISVKFIDSVNEAISHINRYGTKHSESIVTDDVAIAEEFLNGVDASAVYHNAATSFTDGGQFGLGAEIGISTQKLHARGPFALEALTSYKYVLHGDGQIRD